jgi:hypothetical protein
MNLTSLVVLPQADTNILKIKVAEFSCLWRNYLQVWKFLMSAKDVRKKQKNYLEIAFNNDNLVIYKFKSKK